MELTIEIRAKPEKLQELYQTLQALLPTIRNEKGCRDCRISRDTEEGGIFFLSMHWEGRASLSASRCTSAVVPLRHSATPKATFRCSSGPLPAVALASVFTSTTDAGREWAYDRTSNIGRFDKGLDEAKAKGWTIVDMKVDWKRVFPFEK